MKAPPKPRILSLIASATEIVCELGFGESLVGRSHECDYPPFVKTLPVCTTPKFDINGRSRQIDARVRAIVEEALSVYHVNSLLLEALKPTHIITQAHCEVCAVSLKEVEKAVAELMHGDPKIVALEPNCLEDVWHGFLQIGTSLGNLAHAKDVVGRLSRRMARITEKTSLIQKRPTVACIEWMDPLMAAGNWMPELVEMAGGINLFGEAGKHAPGMTWDEVRRRNPEAIVVLPCGFDIPRTSSEMNRFTERPGYPDLTAVRNGRVFVADGNQYFNRPGPRLVESLEMLCEMFHPDLFHFGYEGKGWVRQNKTVTLNESEGSGGGLPRRASLCSE